MPKPNLELIAQVRDLADGTRSSSEIANMLGRNPRHIRKLLLKYNLPRWSEGAQAGSRNHQHKTGRRLTKAGYVQVTAPEGHPTAKPRQGRKARYMFEHRLVAEQKLGRLLLDTERVDHIDGLTLHNHPHNLRVFATNEEHLAATLEGRHPHRSVAGLENIERRYRF